MIALQKSQDSMLKSQKSQKSQMSELKTQGGLRAGNQLFGIWNLFVSNGFLFLQILSTRNHVDDSISVDYSTKK